MSDKEYEKALRADIAAFAWDPYSHVRYCWPDVTPREWQEECLNTIADHLSGPDRFEPLLISVASGHGIGKSALISWIGHWGLSTCADTKIILTANTDKQLTTKTWPEVCKWFHSAPNRRWWEVVGESIYVKESGHEKLWRMDRITWSENNTEAFAGAHNQGKRLIILFDEASAIADRIWEVTEGALTDDQTEIIWICFGNPTQNTGRFARCFGDLKHRWIHKQIDSRKVEGTNKAQIQKWIDDYGEDSDFVRVRVRGEFPRAGSTQFIPGDIVQAARSRTVLPNPREYKILSFDPARFGSDQGIIGYRQGNVARILQKLRGVDTVQGAKYLLRHIREIRPRVVVVDGDGLGAGVVDYIREQTLVDNKSEWANRLMVCGEETIQFRLVEFHGGEKAYDEQMNANRRAEVWGDLKDWLKGEVSIDDDPELDSHLTGVQYGFRKGTNSILLESKDDMKRRGLDSPDTGDQLAMTFAAKVPMQTKEEKFQEQMDAAPPAVRMLLNFKHHQELFGGAKPQRGSKRPSWKK